MTVLDPSQSTPLDRDGPDRSAMALSGRVDDDTDALRASEAPPRLQVESALHESERRFREMIDALPVAIYTTDAEGRLTHFNPAAAQLSGRVPELGTDQWCVTWKLYHPDGTPMPHDTCPMASALKEGRAIRGGEIIAERPDGGRVWLSAFPTPLTDAGGRVVGGINMLIDVTERKRAEEALRRSENELAADVVAMRRLQETSIELLREDDPEALYERILDAAVAIMRSDFASIQMYHPERGVAGELRLLGHRGFSPEAARAWEWVRPASETTCAMAIHTGRRVIVADVDACEEMAGSEDLRTYRETGIRAVQSTPLLSRSGRMLGMLSTHWRAPHAPSERDLRLFDVLARQAADRIERAHAEQKLRASEEALREAARRKDEFLAMLAHELRNPLAPIGNAAQLLKRIHGDQAKQQWAADIIERQTQHMTRLVDDLLDVSRITQGKIALSREPLDLAAVVNRAVETSRPLIDARGHGLRVVLPPDKVVVEGDLTRLVQCIGNLLNNAAKYTDEGGDIEIEAWREGHHAVVRVRDNGSGVSQDLLPRIFDLFAQGEQSLDRSQGGLGIGLTLVRRLVELHGGSVEARSEGLGCGSEFVIRLPAMPDTSERLGPNGARIGAQRAGHVSASRVLLIEDNADSAQAIAALLALGGREVRTIHDGAMAAQAMREFRPHAILCDIGLPGMSGYEVAEQLRADPAFNGTCMIAITGYGQHEDRRRALAAGFDHHLTKPVDVDRLEALLGTPERGG